MMATEEFKLFSLLVEEVHQIKNLLIAPPIPITGLDTYEDYHAYIDARKAASVADTIAPPPKNHVSCDTCRQSFFAAPWDTPNDVERKKMAGGPPCATCDMPMDARDFKHETRAEAEKSCTMCYFFHKRQIPNCDAGCSNYKRRLTTFEETEGGMSIRCPGIDDVKK